MNRRAFLAALLAAPIASRAEAHTAPSPSERSALAPRISARYRVSRHAVERVAQLAAEAFPRDPRLLLAIVGVESSWRPWAIGDHGEIGLCQVRPDMHGPGSAALLDPEVNLRTAGALLERHVARFGMLAGVARYNGAGPEAEKYAARVLAERRRLARDERIADEVFRTKAGGQ